MDMHFWIAALLCLLGAGLVGLSCWKVYEALQARSWPSVNATIITSSIEREEDDGIVYRVKVTYQYCVQGKHFVGDRIYTAGEVAHSWLWLTKRTAKKYPVGATVPAYYAPNNPSCAVLKLGLNSVPFSLFMIGVFLLFNAWMQFDVGMSSP